MFYKMPERTYGYIGIFSLRQAASDLNVSVGDELMEGDTFSLCLGTTERKVREIAKSFPESLKFERIVKVKLEVLDRFPWEDE